MRSTAILFEWRRNILNYCSIHPSILQLIVYWIWRSLGSKPFVSNFQYLHWLFRHCHDCRRSKRCHSVYYHLVFNEKPIVTRNVMNVIEFESYWNGGEQYHIIIVFIQLCSSSEFRRLLNPSCPIFNIYINCFVTVTIVVARNTVIRFTNTSFLTKYDRKTDSQTEHDE